MVQCTIEIRVHEVADATWDEVAAALRHKLDDAEALLAGSSQFFTGGAHNDEVGQMKMSLAREVTAERGRIRMIWVILMDDLGDTHG